MTSAQVAPHVPDPIAESALPDAARRRRNRGRLVRTIDQIILGVLLIAAWQFYVTSRHQTFKFSTPKKVANDVWHAISSGSIFPHLFATLQEVAIGFVIGLAVGLVLAALLFEFRILYRLLDPILIGIYSIPNAALAPVFIIWFGIGLKSKVILVALTTFFIVFYEIHAALQNVSTGLINAMRLMGSGRKDIYLKVMLPASRDWIVHGCRLAFPRAFTAAIIGEIIAANRGLGYLARYQAGVYDSGGALSTLFIILCITVPMHYLLAAWRTKAKN